MKVVKIVILVSCLTGGLKGLHAVTPGENDIESLWKMWNCISLQLKCSCVFEQLYLKTEFLNNTGYWKSYFTLVAKVMF